MRYYRDMSGISTVVGRLTWRSSFVVLFLWLMLHCRHIGWMRALEVDSTQHRFFRHWQRDATKIWRVS